MTWAWWARPDWGLVLCSCCIAPCCVARSVRQSNSSNLSSTHVASEPFTAEMRLFWTVRLPNGRHPNCTVRCCAAAAQHSIIEHVGPVGWSEAKRCSTALESGWKCLRRPTWTSTFEALTRAVLDYKSGSPPSNHIVFSLYIYFHLIFMDIVAWNPITCRKVINLA